MASDKAQYIVALISEFASHFGISTVQAAQYLSRYKALELFDRQYDYLHTQSFESNVRDLSAYCRRMGGELLGRMNVSEREFSFMVEGVTSDLVQLLMDRRGYALSEAVDAVYGSSVYAALLRPTSGLYSQSSGYVYSLLEGEISNSSKLRNVRSIEFRREGLGLT